MSVLPLYIEPPRNEYAVDLIMLGIGIPKCFPDIHLSK